MGDADGGGGVAQPGVGSLCGSATAADPAGGAQGAVSLSQGGEAVLSAFGEGGEMDTVVELFWINEETLGAGSARP